MKSQRLNRYKGTASEHLVCADIWLQGYKAYMVPGDVFDVILKAENQLLKLQVKSSSFNEYSHKKLTYCLNSGCNNKKLYQISEIDAWAFVDLIYKKVCYMDVKDLNNRWKISINRKDFKDLTLKVLLENKIGNK